MNPDSLMRAEKAGLGHSFRKASRPSAQRTRHASLEELNARLAGNARLQAQGLDVTRVSLLVLVARPHSFRTHLH